MLGSNLLRTTVKRLVQPPQENPIETPTNVETTNLDIFVKTLFNNQPLQSKEESKAASALVERLGLRSHHDPQKNWDTLKCYFHILSCCDPHSPVLDVGSSRAVVLAWLERLGYSSLHACDLRDMSKRFKDSSIQFTVQDLTKTTYPDKYFRNITSISVIEHGIPLEPYLKEMQRILKPGGLLLTSTDYWSEKIDCKGIYPYGEDAGEMQVFNPESIQEFVTLAQGLGFELTSPLSLHTEEKAVRWERVNREYTFLFVALRNMGSQ